MKPLIYLLLGLLLVAGRRAQAQQAGAADTVQVRLAEADFDKARLINQGLFRLFSAEAHTSLGVGAARYAGLNDALTAAGLPALTAVQFTYGFGFSGRFQRVVLGIDGVFYQQEHDAAGRRLQLSSSTALPHLGYAWFSEDYAHELVPTLGVAYHDAELTVTELAPAGAPAVGSLLAGTPYSRTLHYHSTCLALGMQYNWFPFDTGTLKRCQLGLRAQYLPRLGSGRYYTGDPSQPVPGPACDPLLFSARAVLGFCF